MYFVIVFSCSLYRRYNRYQRLPVMGLRARCTESSIIIFSYQQIKHQHKPMQYTKTTRTFGVSRHKHGYEDTFTQFTMC